MIGGLNLSMDVIMCKSYSKKSLIDFTAFYKNLSHGKLHRSHIYKQVDEFFKLLFNQNGAIWY